MEGGKREGRRAELLGAAGASGKRARGEEGLRVVGAPTSPRSPGSSPSLGSPSALPRLRGWAGSLSAGRFPNWWVAPSGARPFNPGSGRGRRLRPCPVGGVPVPPRSSPSAAPLASASADSYSASPGTGVRSEPRGYLPECSLAQPTRADSYGGHPRPGQGLYSGGAAPRLHRSLR